MIKDQRPWADLLGGLRGWDRGQNSCLSEKGHVAYQIKGNDACFNKVANILPSAPQTRSLGWGQKVKFQLFSEHGHVAYHTKWNHGCSNTVANICNPRTKGQHSFFQDMVNIQLFQTMVMLHVEIKWNHECSNHGRNRFAHSAPPDSGASTYSVLT